MEFRRIYGLSLLAERQYQWNYNLDLYVYVYWALTSTYAYTNYSVRPRGLCSCDLSPDAESKEFTQEKILLSKLYSSHGEGPNIFYAVQQLCCVWISSVEAYIK